MKQLLILVLFLTGAIQAQALPNHGKMGAAELAELIAHRSEYSYEGIVKLDNCSGAIIRFEGSKDTDKAVALTNGHCYKASFMGGMIKPGEFVFNKAAKRDFTLLSKSGSLTNNTIRSTKAIYVTMTGTDISLYELALTYGEIKSKYNTNAIFLESSHPVLNEPIDILSGYFQIGYSCTISKFVYELKEAGYTMTDSIRYSETGCQTKHGTSGSPILSRRTGRIIGINNTGNDNGEKCTMDNPCEVDPNGNVFVKKGLSYGQETYQIYTCLNSANQIDLNLPGCKLYHSGAML